MILGLSINQLLILALFFITALNCAITYFCCNKSLKIYEDGKFVSKAVNNLRVMDQYVLSKINIVIALLYFGISYVFVESKLEFSGYVFFLSCLLSFVLTLFSTYASRVCYCYTCNLLLETKLNEYECFVFNFKRLIMTYAPFLIISLVVPSVYMIDTSNFIRNASCLIILVIIFLLWIILTPKVVALSYGAKEIESNSLLRHRLVQLMKKHHINKYKLYYWDSSRSKESNAMVSGIVKSYLFVSSTLIEELTLPELEAVITHEIGHIKNKHMLKMMIIKLFSICSLVLMALLPIILELDFLKKVGFYFFAVLAVVFGVIVSTSIERKYEEEADMYAVCYSPPELFASALKKISKYEDEEKGKIDGLFQSHPDTEERIKKIKK